MATYFKTPDGYVAVTKTSPKGFKGVLYLGKGGPLGKITEQLFTPDQLRSMKPVELHDVPADWVIEAGYDEPVEPEYEDFPLLDPEGENLVALIPLRKLEPRPSTPNGRFWYDIGLLIGVAIGIAWILI